MKNGDYAVYLGKEYTSGYMEDGKIILRSTDIKDVIKGFIPCKPFRIKEEEKKIVCIKYVYRTEVESYYWLKTKAKYKGYEFEMVEETDDEIAIETMGGNYRIWESLGMECVDRGVYQKWIKKEEAEEIWIEREED